jgi:ATP-dependent helicase/nuclease subunit B
VFDAATAGYTVLAPNTELAAALFDVVERMHAAAAHAIWPTPRIRDFGSWLRERYVQHQLDDAALPRCLNDVEERELWRAVIRDSAAGKEFLEPAGAARSARRARRAMFEHAIPMQALAEYATEESQALFNWNRRFEEHCRELDCIASDQLLSRVRPDSQPMVWIDSPIWRPVARHWLDTHGAAMLSPEDLPTPAVAHQLRSAAPDAELAAIADWARINLQERPDFRGWVCIPDMAQRRGQLIDAFDAALAPQRFSVSARETYAAYAVAGGTPLADFAPVRAALNSLSAAIGPLGFEAFSALLRMPELQASHEDAAAAACLDLALRTRGPSEASIREWLLLSARLLREGLSRPVAALQRLQDFLKVLDALGGAHPVSRWAAAWVEAFEVGPWVERCRWSSSEFQAAERFRELLGTMATGDDLFGARSAASAARLLQRAAHDTAFQVQTGIPSIWVSGQIMDPWLSYDGLWIAGCSEERWPPSPDPIPLVPVPLQRQHGVLSASADAQLQLASDLQLRWQSRARSSVYSCADPGDGRSSNPSPLLPAGSPPTGPSAMPQPHWHAMAALVPPFQCITDEQAPAFTAPERTRGVATLRAQSRCPFRGFAETRLAIEVLGRPSPGFNMIERGNMVHHALEHVWSDVQASARLATLSAEHRAALLRDSVARAIAKQCERRDPGLQWQRREAPRMVALLGKWLQVELLREPFEVERLEHAAQTARLGGVEFTVRIDRMDRLSDGARVLIDYKTGTVTADWRGDRPHNPQLPIYALLHPDALVAVAYGRVDAGECGFVAETARSGIFKLRAQPSRLEGQPDFAALVDLWSQRIEKLAVEFAAGHAAVAPTLRACESCRLQPLCRVPSALADDPGLR